MNLELDVEKRLQALVAKDRVRIKEFFIDFDKLRKGWVGEAAVSIILLIFTDSCCSFLVPHLPRNPQPQVQQRRHGFFDIEVQNRWHWSG